jgi:hypothetical protein
VFSLTILLEVQDKEVNILVNTTSLRINLNIDGETTPPKTPISLGNLSVINLSLGVPVPRTTQLM